MKSAEAFILFVLLCSIACYLIVIYLGMLLHVSLFIDTKVNPMY